MVSGPERALFILEGNKKKIMSTKGELLTSPSVPSVRAVKLNAGVPQTAAAAPVFYVYMLCSYKQRSTPATRLLEC